MSNGTSTASLDLWDPVQCLPFEGNTILLEVLQVKPHAYPNRLVYFAAHYFGYLLLAWLVLTFFPKKDALVCSRKSPFENMFLPFMRLFVSRQGDKRSLGKKVGGQSLEKKESLNDESGVQVDIPDHDDQGQHQVPSRVPVTIRAVNLSLALVKRGFFEIAGIYRSCDEAPKILLSNIDIEIAPAKLTAILGGSGSGKVVTTTLRMSTYDMSTGEFLFH